MLKGSGNAVFVWFLIIIILISDKSLKNYK